MIQLIIVVLIVGLLAYLIEHYVPFISPPYKKIVYAIMIICTLVYVLVAFGVLGGADIPVPQLR